jgi:uncharacterized protein (TIGR00251 family)
VPSDDPPFLRRTQDRVMIELRAQPRARRNALDCGADGVLKVAITAPAEDGKANAAVIDLLAREWHLPKSAFQVARGASARQKVLGISGEPATIAARITAWLRQRAGDHG